MKLVISFGNVESERVLVRGPSSTAPQPWWCLGLTSRTTSTQASSSLFSSSSSDNLKQQTKHSQFPDSCS